MKNLMFGFVCVIGMMTTAATPAKAQVNVSVNISSQPLWGPVGYDYVEYYYLPDLEMYYYVPAHKFVYINGGRWVFASSLPYYYSGYDLYSVHKVVINEPRPYRHFHSHKKRYAYYRGGPHKQVFIRNSYNSKYYVVKGHPRHNRASRINAHPQRPKPYKVKSPGVNGHPQRPGPSVKQPASKVNGNPQRPGPSYKSSSGKVNGNPHKPGPGMKSSRGKVNGNPHKPQGGGGHGGGHKGGKR